MVSPSPEQPQRKGLFANTEQLQVEDLQAQGGCILATSDALGKQLSCVSFQLKNAPHRGRDMHHAQGRSSLRREGRGCHTQTHVPM